MSEMFPVLSVDSIDVEEANDYLEMWRHPLGACNRPFEQRAHALIVHGVTVGITVMASTVSATCGGMPRLELVELARIGRSPSQPWVLRPLLRIWREVCVKQWQTNPVAAAVSYAIPGKPGNIYRFDGWERVCQTKPSSGGGTWSNRPAVNAIGDGVKTLWRFRYAKSESSAGTAP